MKILSVDDKRENLYFLQALLEGNGYEVISAENGAEALKVLQTQSCDMIITDILMPVMDGFQLCRTVKADTGLQHIPLVFYTATYIDHKDEQFALSLGADKFLRKPTEPEAFIQVIQNIVQGKETSQSPPRKPLEQEEEIVLKLYNERLVQKLEKKMFDLEKEVADRMHAEKQTAQALEQTRDLSRRLGAAEEEERKRMARELHDEFGQALTGLKLDLAWLKKKVGRSSGKQPLADIQGRLDSMTNLVDQTIHSVRRIATSLRPSILDDLGLIPALESQVRYFQNRTGLCCEFSVSSKIRELDIDPSISTAFFRIAQEMLTNVARHAQASTVCLNLEREGNWMVMEATDDGIGINMGKTPSQTALGLLGLQERTQHLGGTCIIKGTPHEGTTISVRIPIP